MYIMQTYILPEVPVEILLCTLFALATQINSTVYAVNTHK